MKFGKEILIAAAITLSSCGGGGGGGTRATTYTNPNITATQFVNALKTYDGNNSTALLLDETLTYRSTISGQDQWIVVYDAELGENVAISLDYLRQLGYISTSPSNVELAGQFRFEIDTAVIDWNQEGDSLGENFEIVDLFSDGYYYGRVTNYAYEDEMETTDVNLMVATAEEKRIANRVSNISMAYSVDYRFASKIVKLGEKVSAMTSNSQEDLTEEDKEVLLKDLQELTGVTLEEVMEASLSPNGRSEIAKKIAKKNEEFGVTSDKIENQILPELFGL